MNVVTNSQRAVYGLTLMADPQSEAVENTQRIGPASASINLTNATVAYSFAVEVDGLGYVTLDLASGAATPTGSGSAQVETATAAGTITGSGNATVIVTSADIEGSPLTVPVAVTNGDTAATWAGKVRTALGLLPAITDVYTVGGSTTSIVLTKNALETHDLTLNISLANGTCTGITAAPTSDSTTPGVAPTKVYRIAGTTFANDTCEGEELPNDLDAYQGILVRHMSETGSAYIQCDSGDGFEDVTFIKAGGVYLEANNDGLVLYEGAFQIKFLSASGGFNKLQVVLLCSRAA